MSAPVAAEDASEQRPAPGREAPDPGQLRTPAPSARDVVGATCPYLTSSAGSWRMAMPSRDHRCAAVEPPVPQPTDKQRRHCLSADHVECSTFRAARSARQTSLAGGADPALVVAADGRRRPLARTAPILLEPPRLVDRAVRLQLERAPGQAALIGLMVVAFAIVALTRLSSGTGATVASPPASFAAVVASATPRPTQQPEPSSSSPLASASPAVSAPPSFRTTYKVKKGDTLLGIANKYKTTPAKIRSLNGLTSSTLKVGQVLKIP